MAETKQTDKEDDERVRRGLLPNIKVLPGSKEMTEEMASRYMGAMTRWMEEGNLPPFQIELEVEGDGRFVYATVTPSKDDFETWFEKMCALGNRALKTWGGTRARVRAGPRRERRGGRAAVRRDRKKSQRRRK